MLDKDNIMTGKASEVVQNEMKKIIANAPCVL